MGVVEKLNMLKSGAADTVSVPLALSSTSKARANTVQLFWNHVSGATMTVRATDSPTALLAAILPVSMSWRDRAPMPAEGVQQLVRLLRLMPVQCRPSQRCLRPGNLAWSRTILMTAISLDSQCKCPLALPASHPPTFA